jgi:hypothetical protein
MEDASEPAVAILQGRKFDEVVRGLEPGVVISRDDGMPAAIAETSRLMALGAAGPQVLYQPVFQRGISRLSRTSCDGRVKALSSPR